MIVAVISDTHDTLRDKVREIVGRCDAVIHAGDIASPATLRQLKSAMKDDAQLYAVRGNADGEWASDLPTFQTMELDGWKLCVAHKKKDVPKLPEGVKIVICGHTHKYQCTDKDGRLWLNPGCCGPRRPNQEITMAVLSLLDDGYTAEKITIPHDRTAGDEMAVIPADGDLLSAIQKIMKRMDKGQTVERISRELGLNKEFTEQICRICVTHPGVTAEGILNKVEANRMVE